MIDFLRIGTGTGKEKKDAKDTLDDTLSPPPTTTSSYGPREDLVFTPSTYLGITKCCFCIDHRGGGFL